MPDHDPPQAVHDHLERPFAPLRRPCRVVSLVPSWTETLFALGLSGDEVVGRTTFCTRPDGISERVPKLGGTKTPKLDRILELEPDVVIVNRDENRKEHVEALDFEFEDLVGGPRCFITHPRDVLTALAEIDRRGALLQATDEAAKLRARIEAARDRLPTTRRGRALYLVWRRPWISASPDTFVHGMMDAAGFDNVIDEAFLDSVPWDSDGQRRYPPLDEEQIVALAPDVILLSSEPFPFRAKHVDELREQLAEIDAAFAKRVDIAFVDGEHYSWYGARTAEALEAFAEGRVTVPVPV